MTREYDSAVDFEISLGNVELYKTLGLRQKIITKSYNVTFKKITWAIFKCKYPYQ